MTYKLDDVLKFLDSNKEKLPIVQPKPNDSLIAEYENQIGIVFPDDYKKFLKTVGYAIYNGRDNIPASNNLDNPRGLITVAKEAHQMGVPKDWLPIAEDNSDYFCIRPDNKIAYWSHNGQTEEVWADLATWIKEVWIDEG